jgi:tetratricopeptide (TPR) repeat protein
MSSALWRFWQMRGHLTEGRERIEAVLILAEQALDPILRMTALDAAGGIAYWQGDVAGAERFYRTCLEVSRKSGDRDWSARSLSSLAYTLRGLAGTSGSAGSADLALRTAEKALAEFRDLGDDAGEAGALRLIAILQAARGNLDVARVAADTALHIFARLNRPFDLAWTLRQVGVIEMRGGQMSDAGRSLRDSLRLFAGLLDISSMPVLLGDLATLAVAQGDPERAAHLSDAAAAMQASSGARWASVVRKLDRDPGPEPDTEIGPESPWTRGAAFAIEDVLDYALG